jgi:hypothetical protein
MYVNKCCRHTSSQQHMHGTHPTYLRPHHISSAIHPAVLLDGWLMGLRINAQPLTSADQINMRPTTNTSSPIYLASMPPTPQLYYKAYLILRTLSHMTLNWFVVMATDTPHHSKAPAGVHRKCRHDSLSISATLSLYLLYTVAPCCRQHGVGHGR